MNAILPDELYETTLEDVLIGEIVWITPWMMYPDTDGYLWLNGATTFYYERRGTVSLEVKRTHDGWVVSIARCTDHRWSRKRNPMSGVVISSCVPLPVIELKKHPLKLLDRLLSKGTP